MQRVLFICHGNICRSTMAESVFTELVRRAGRAGEFVIDSAATSTEEIGNPPHLGTVAKLREVGIPVVAHRARQVRRAEYGDWIALSIWMLRTRAACVASLATTPTAGLRACSTGPIAPATWPILVYRQFRCHLPRRARRLRRYARAAVGSRRHEPREPRHRHTDRAWIFSHFEHSSAL